jgi:probable F420-dependent oxidoreductase
MLPPLGKVGVFSVPMEVVPAATGIAFARELEELGYSAVWTGEGLGTREMFTNAAAILAGTEKIVWGSGIANIWARDPVTTVTATRTLNESYGNRFLLGLGISHREQVDPRGHVYEKPIDVMRRYLGAMASAKFVSPMPTETAQTAPVQHILAALRPAMLRLAAEASYGAHPYMTTPEHTAMAREILGPEKLLVPEQAFVLAKDPSEARRIGRTYMSWYVGIENFRRSLLAQGFSEEDLDTQSDHLVDSIVAWGNEDAIRDRVKQHLDAGADHVPVQAVALDPLDLCTESYRRVAAALLEL